MNYAILNGQIIDKKEAVIPVNDKAYFFDFALYESLKIIKGKAFWPEYHIDRLIESAKIIDLGHKFTKQNALDWINILIEKNELVDAYVKIILIGDSEKNINERFYIIPVTGVTFYPKKSYNRGVKVITYQGQRRFPKAKTKDLLMSFLANREAKRRDAFEALLVDNDGFIREGARSNFFAIKGNKIYMPPDEKDLGGITKIMLMKACEAEFEFIEKDILPNELQDYDELFISSTLMNAMPIGQVDDIKLRDSFVQVKKIGKLFKKYYEKEVLKVVD